jgi:hypothetical protein
MAPGEQLLLGHEAEDTHPYIKARRDLIKASPDWWYNLPTIETGFWVVSLFRTHGFKLQICTRGSKNCLDSFTQKARWCAKHVPDARITVTTGDKSLNYGAVLFDDWPEYVTPWLKARPRGTVIMPDRPWNAGFEHPRVVRYDGMNLDEVDSAIRQQAERIASYGV